MAVLASFGGRCAGPGSGLGCVDGEALARQGRRSCRPGHPPPVAREGGTHRAGNNHALPGVVTFVPDGAVQITVPSEIGLGFRLSSRVPWGVKEIRRCAQRVQPRRRPAHLGLPPRLGQAVVPPLATARSLPMKRGTNTCPRALSSGKNDTMPGRSFDDANAFHRTCAPSRPRRWGWRFSARRQTTSTNSSAGSPAAGAASLGSQPAFLRSSCTTTGAKSGEPRTVAVYGIPHPDGLSSIAPTGAHEAPGLVPQLKANPEATVPIEGDTWQATARPATLGERDETGRKASRSTPAGGIRSTGRANANRGVRPQPYLRSIASRAYCQSASRHSRA